MPTNENAGRRPDAIRAPRDYPAPRRRGDDREKLRDKVFGAVFGTKKVWSRKLPLHDESLITPLVDRATDLKHGIFFPKGHPLEGQDRYHWFIAVQRPDGSFVPSLPVEGDEHEDGRIKLGYLKDDPHENDPATLAAMRAAYDDRLREYHSSPEYLERMKELGVEPVAAPGYREPTPEAPPAPINAPRPIPDPHPET